MDFSFGFLLEGNFAKAIQTTARNGCKLERDQENRFKQLRGKLPFRRVFATLSFAIEAISSFVTSSKISVRLRRTAVICNYV